MTFTWPNSTPGTPDNVVADGQSFPLTASGSTLGFLASGTGDTSGTGIITYTDGTTQAYSLAINDWTNNSSPAPGSDILVTLPHRNASGGGSTNVPVHIYSATITLQAGKTVAYLTLPDVPGMHIFATAIG